MYVCFYQFVKLSLLSVRRQKMALWVLLKGRLVGKAKPNAVSFVCLCSPVKMVYFFLVLVVCLMWSGRF